jgi:hypothetical protein
MNSLLTPKEQKKMISYGKPNGTTYKKGGATASKKSGCGCKK